MSHLLDSYHLPEIWTPLSSLTFVLHLAICCVSFYRSCPLTVLGAGLVSFLCASYCVCSWLILCGYSMSWVFVFSFIYDFIIYNHVSLYFSIWWLSSDNVQWIKRDSLELNVPELYEWVNAWSHHWTPEFMDHSSAFATSEFVPDVSGSQHHQHL